MVSNRTLMPDEKERSYPSPWFWRLTTAADAAVAAKRAKAAFIVPAQEG